MYITARKRNGGYNLTLAYCYSDISDLKQVFSKEFLCKNLSFVLLRSKHFHTEILMVFIFVDDAGIPTSPAPTPFRETPGEVTKCHLIKSVKEGIKNTFGLRNHNKSTINIRTV